MRVTLRHRQRELAMGQHAVLQVQRSGHICPTAAAYRHLCVAGTPCKAITVELDEEQRTVYITRNWYSCVLAASNTLEVRY